MRKAVFSELTIAFAAIAIGAAGCSSFGANTPPLDGGNGVLDSALVDGAIADDSDGGIADGAADAAVACPESCNATKNECVALDFGGAGCPANVTLTGGTGKASCGNGNLRISAAGGPDAGAGADAGATLTLKPLANNVVHVGVKATVDDWVGTTSRRLAQISSGNNVLATVQASTKSGKVTFALCGGTTECAAIAREVEKGTPFYLSFIIQPDGKGELAIDCDLVGRFEGASGAQADKNFLVVLGDQEGDPIKGSFDDLVVWFEPR